MEAAWRSTRGVRSWTRSCTWCAPAAHGGSCRRLSALVDGVLVVRPAGEAAGHAAEAGRAAAAGPAGRRTRRQASAGIIDLQSVKAADIVGRGTCGYDAGKKVAGRKRFLVTDTLGLLVTVCVATRTAAVPRAHC